MTTTILLPITFDIFFLKVWIKVLLVSLGESQMDITPIHHSTHSNPLSVSNSALWKEPKGLRTDKSYGQQNQCPRTKSKMEKSSRSSGHPADAGSLSSLALGWGPTTMCHKDHSPEKLKTPWRGQRVLFPQWVEWCCICLFGISMFYVVQFSKNACML